MSWINDNIWESEPIKGLGRQFVTRVLIIEDDKRISDLLALYLEHEGYEVERAYDGLEGVGRADQCDPDLIILDLMLPKLHGRDACIAIRYRSQAPILMLTALDDDRDVIDGLDVGADDYLTKPFQPAVLLARIRALLRRAGQATSSLESGLSICIENLTIYTSERRAEIDHQDIMLRPREFDLLLTFAQQPNRVFSREMLIDTLWDGDVNVGSRTVDVHINRLRRQIRNANARIETIRGYGYRLAPTTTSE